MSDFSAEDRQLIADGAERFVAERYLFEERERRLSQSPYGVNWSEFAELGWLAMPFSAEHGGLGASIEDVQVLMAAFGRGLVEEPYFDSIVLAARVIEQAGTAEQRQLLDSCISGELRLCLAHREKGSEFDAGAIACTATEVEGGFLLNGRKNVIYAAGCADSLIVSARCGDSLQLFLVPASTPGLTLQCYPTVDTRQAADIELNDVKVPNSARIGADPSASWPLFQQVLLQAMAALCGEAVGIAHQLLKQTGEYLQSREQFGVPLATFQALQHRYADMAMMEMEISAAAAMAAAAADSINEPESEQRIRSAKVRIGELGRSIGEEAIQMHGGIGVTNEFIVGHYLRRLLAIDRLLGDKQEHLLWLAHWEKAK